MTRFALGWIAGALSMFAGAYVFAKVSMWRDEREDEGP